MCRFCWCHADMCLWCLTAIQEPRPIARSMRMQTMVSVIATEADTQAHKEYVADYIRETMDAARKHEVVPRPNRLDIYNITPPEKELMQVLAWLSARFVNRAVSPELRTQLIRRFLVKGATNMQVIWLKDNALLSDIVMDYDYSIRFCQTHILLFTVRQPRQPYAAVDSQSHASRLRSLISEPVEHPYNIVDMLANINAPASSDEDDESDFGSDTDPVVDLPEEEEEKKDHAGEESPQV